MMDYTIKELLPIVQKLSEQYTQKESTSIRIEILQQLMEAVIYCIMEQEQSILQQEKYSLKNMEHISAEKAYQSGYEMVIQKTKDANKIYSDLIMDFHSYGCKNLYDTVILEMPKFFISYDAKFSPQTHNLILSYPTLHSRESLTGIDQIYLYLCDLKSEQIILSHFTEEEILNSLEKYHTDYEEELFNICSIVVKHKVLQQWAEEIENLQETDKLNQDKLKTDFIFTFWKIAEEEKEYLIIVAEECWNELMMAIDGNYLNTYLRHYCWI